MKLQKYLDTAIKNISELEDRDYECASYAINDLFNDLSNEIEGLEYQANDSHDEIKDLHDQIKDLQDEIYDLKSDLRNSEYREER